MGWSTTVAATGTTRGSAAMMREAISGLLLANLRGGFATAKSSYASSSTALLLCCGFPRTASLLARRRK